MTELIAPTAGEIARAGARLRAGGLVAFPTETVYGLGADALDAFAAARIFEAKRRALNDPLIVHVTSLASLVRVMTTDALNTLQTRWLHQLANAFWPGPLTLVGPKQTQVPDVVSAGTATVGVRIPSHPVARALIDAAGTPIAAPSANLFGHVSPTTARHVLDDLDGRIDLVIDGGPTPLGVESTVLSLMGDTPVVLRPGGISRAQIQALGIPLAAHAPATDDQQAQPAPGMLSSHYAPRAQVHLCETSDALPAHYENLRRTDAGKTGALILKRDLALCADIRPQYVMGASAEDAARSLYAGLRALDAAGCAHILVAPIPDGDLAEAVRDRLMRAAAKRGTGR
jgi:L-threonylcarbamoyladenylate synthase